MAGLQRRLDRQVFWKSGVWPPSGGVPGYPWPMPSVLIVFSIGGMVLIYAGVLVALLLLGRRGEAQALVRFIPDCLILFRRLLADDRVPRSRKLVLLLVLAYLALPFDLIPDFIPVAGQLDDAIVVGLGLRFVLRAGGPDLLEEHLPGPSAGVLLIGRIAFGAQLSASVPSVRGPRQPDQAGSATG